MGQVKQYSLEQCHEKTLEWSHDRGILTNGKSITQALKLGSEVGELQDNVAKGLCIKDDIGDCLVVLTNLANLEGLTLSECWSHAYHDIKDRQGFLNANGNFIKSTDPTYAQQKIEFEKQQSPEPHIVEMNVQQADFDHTVEVCVLLSDGTVEKLSFYHDNTLQQTYTIQHFMGKPIAELQRAIDECA